MKLIPTKKQWQSWTLPSKASYIGVIITLFSLIVGLIINSLSASYIKKFNQPQLTINSQNKPYLRYETTDDGGIKFSYELSIKNSGKSTAIDGHYLHIKQKLVMNDRVIVQVSNPSGYKVPSKIVSGEDYFQIFNLSGNRLKVEQINELINNYESEKLAVGLDIAIEYTDAITNKKYKTSESLMIYKNKVLIM